MSLPPIPRASGLPSLYPPLYDTAPTEKPERSTPEVLVITVDDDANDPDGLIVNFEGFGFDVSDDEIVLDLIRMAAYSYGYDLKEQ